MRTFTTVKHSSRINGRHSQKDIGLLTGTCDFILYLLPALLSLFSRTKHWALLQGSQRVSRQAARATPLTHSVTGHLMQSPCTPKLSNQGVKPSRVKDGRVWVEVGCSECPIVVRGKSRSSAFLLDCSLRVQFVRKLIFGRICNSPKCWRWRTVGRPPSHSVSILRVGNSYKLEL